jgi:hypothetical protein
LAARLAVVLRTPASRNVSTVCLTHPLLFQSLKTRKQDIQTALKLFVKRHFFAAGSKDHLNKGGPPRRAGLKNNLIGDKGECVVIEYMAGDKAVFLFYAGMEQRNHYVFYQLTTGGG